ncbi:AB hydrolase-1 domain-containing protein [Citrus sinensis]|uniref:AB hydrolase-1 domain-containing protein n=1 Tax=Citrus sinensis TaxID=2711 RepID=A0ACB8MMY7_CITSI|nr:AB hydrolase-1 domain-containing protein [Citrus sinensis]KAH9786520.1 AB hydrolase-1 domain-containing protein [Citrus sinensis]
MEKIKHTTVATNGINMHVASIGTGPAVLFLHGFPELWYSWRKQLLYLSSRGYRAIAPDLRGYGDTDAPPSITSYTALHVVGDLVFLVGHDWGALIAWYFCLLRPDRVKALVNLSVVFRSRNPATKPVDQYRALFGDDFYICRFQEPGVAEEDFAQIDTARLIKKFLGGRSPKPPCVPKEIGFRGLPDLRTLPSWLSEEDVNYYASKFSQKGFTGGLNYYRCLDLNWELLAPWTGAQIKIPVKFMVGDLDITYHIPGIREYIQNGGFKKDVPGLQEVIVMEGVAHFINQEKADEVSSHIYDFIKQF